MAPVAELIGTTRETPHIVTFRFERGQPPLEWRAGQNLVMTIPGVEDPRGPTRPFTISSSPTEGKYFAVTTIVRDSPFKRRLAGLNLGDRVQIEAVEGEFVLEPGRPAVMIAGGIGVTPFRAMLRFAADTGLEETLILLYSCRTPEDIAFRKELDELPRRNRGIRVEYTITRPEAGAAKWTGRTGRIDSDWIREAMRDIRRPLIYLAGPPGLVREDRAMIEKELHISPEDIRVDEFEGY